MPLEIVKAGAKSLAKDKAKVLLLEKVKERVVLYKKQETKTKSKSL